MSLPSAVSRETLPPRHTPRGWSVRELRAAYGPRIVLDIPTLDLQPGNVTAILGPNGSGKSTLMRCLAGARRPTHGDIRIDGRSQGKTRAADRAKTLAIVPQETPIPFAFTVEELVTLGAEAGPAVAGGSGQERAESAMRRWEVFDLRHTSLTALSGGERQRAALARAWAQNCPYILLDEPTSHLDLRHQAILRDALRAYVAPPHSGGALVVLHDLNLAASLADRIVLLCRGQIVADGAPADVLSEATLREVYQTHLSLRQDASTGERWIVS